MNCVVKTEVAITPLHGRSCTDDAWNVYLRVAAQEVFGIEVPQWRPGAMSPEAEAVCKHCLQVLTAETIKIRKCGIN